MKKGNSRKIVAGVLAAALVLQSSAMTALPSFAEDTADDTVQTETPAEPAEPEVTEASTDPTEPETTEASGDPAETDATEATTAPAETDAPEEATEAAGETDPSEEPSDAEPDTDALTLTGGTVIPAELEQGSFIVVKGTVASAESNITSVDVGIYDSEGKNLYPGTALPNSKSYDLNRMDKYIIFDTLTPGTYTYKVTASNANHTGLVLTEQTFTVVASQNQDDILTLTGGSVVPAELKKGDPVIIRGILTSSSSNITSVNIGIYDNAGTRVSGCEVNPDAKTFDLNTVDEQLTFHKLETGNYTFRVIASNSGNSNVTIVEQAFTVVAEAQAADTLTLTGGTEIPDTIEAGTELTIQGTVTSAVSEITYLTVGVYDGSNNLVTGKTISPKASTYDLSGLSSLVSFEKLTAGNYTYQIIASNAANENYTLFSKAFTVSAGEAAADDLTITGATEIPGSLTQGKIVNVRGVVTSGSSDITSLTAGVYDDDGTMVTGKTVEPKSKSYDLKNLDDDVEFSKLSEGSYTYTVTATNAANINYKLVDKIFTVDKAETSASDDALSISGANEIPATITQGGSLSITGTVTSASSNITALTAGVYDSNKNFVTGRTIAPNAKSYNLKNLDSYVQFNKLPAGTYTYAVIASNANNTNVALVNKQFTVGASTTTTTPSAEDKLTISGGTTIPDTIAVGKSLSITGVVTSASSNITALTAGVYNVTTNEFVTGRTISPNAKSYDLKNLDRYIEFNKLPSGKYLYAVIASNASNNNVALVNKQFTVGDGTTAGTTTPSADDKLTISGGTAIPDTLAAGKALSITGTVTSASSNITSLTAGVYDVTNNTLVTGRTVSPNAKTYNLKNLDNYIEFNKLPAGTYIYAVVATNASNNNYAVVSKQFTVSGSTTTTTPSASDDKLTITGGTAIPDTLAVGKALSITGVVTSASSNITALTAGVYNVSTNAFVTGRTIAPNAKSYDLKNLDRYIEFNKLPAGTYTYAVIATNAANSNYALVNKQFTVGNSGTTANPSASDDKLTISGGTTIPDTLAKGKALSITGTVTSASSNITSLTAGVYDVSTQKFVTGRTIAPNAKSYDLKKLDNYIEFNKLPAGTYTYAVIASNAANTNYTLVSKQFTVGDGGTATTPSANDALTISGGTAIPDTLAQGRALSIKGVVTSASSNITALTAGVYDSNKNFVTGRTIAPNAKSYDLKKLDSYIEFNKLPAGTYTYAVIATNGANTNYALVNKTFTITGDGSGTASDPITISGGTTVPSTLSKGRGVIVSGTISSASSNLTSVTVGVYDANGKQVTGTTVTPNAKTYNLNKVDSQIRFDQLAAGTYYYKVTATNGANSGYTVVNQSFTVR